MLQSASMTNVNLIVKWSYYLHTAVNVYDWSRNSNYHMLFLILFTYIFLNEIKIMYSNQHMIQTFGALEFIAHSLG